MTMFGLYVLCLAVGGGFLAISLFGEVLEADADFSADSDFDAGDASGLAKLFSLRAIVYSLFGFGATGVGLTVAWGEARPTWIMGLSVATGVVAGVFISAVLDYVKRTSSGERLGEASFAGLTARVIVPLASGSTGTVSVERGDRRYSLRAVLDERGDGDGKGPLLVGQSVVVTEVSGGVAYVTPVAGDLFPPLDDS